VDGGLASCAAWDDSTAVDLLDLFLIVLVVLAAYSGYRRGALLQMLTFGGLLLGLFVGATLAPQFAGLAASRGAQAAIALVSFLAIAAVGDALGWVIGSRLYAVARTSRFGSVDAAGGSAVAVVALLLAIWFVGLNLANGPIPSLSRQIRGSAVVRGLDAVLPPPPSLLGQIRKFLDTFGFPQVFAGLPPAPGGPVQAPSQTQAQGAFNRAAHSTFRIVGEACGRIQEGSGFLVAPHYVVTNAHVLAGIQHPRVQQQDGASFRGVPVLFDSKEDIAVLRVRATSDPVLPLVGSEVDRGAVGAVVGYPGGGNLTGVAAANRRVLHAVGRDIYGNGNVVRDIYELQAQIKPGNSGGPFVLVNGKVAGVVFAASTTDPGIGYAITSIDAKPDIRSALGRTAPVGTGPCTR
jgi:S1-C subfamily serine protease